MKKRKAPEGPSGVFMRRMNGSTKQVQARWTCKAHHHMKWSKRYELVLEELERG